MTLLAAERISRSFGDTVILKNLSFTINERSRIALVGKNGIGKTTLLEIIAGRQTPDSGSINRAKSCLVDYIEQEKDEYLHQTLREFVSDARPDLVSGRTEIGNLEHYLSENPGDSKALNKLGELQQQFERAGGFAFDSQVESILTGLGFEIDRFDERLANFSGGERNRAGLARVLAGQGNLLLLDEPTNHLDIESTEWLEQYILSHESACVIVSHDRTFLTNVSQQVWEMSIDSLDTYAGGFEAYLTERSDRRRLHEHRYKHQQDEITRAEEFIRRNMAGQKTKQAQSKLKYLNRIKRLPPPKTDSSGPAIKVQSSGRSWQHVLSVEDVILAYGERTVLTDVGFDLYRGEKIGLVGRNGSGKSTLLKALIGQIDPAAGEIKLGNKVDVAYFDQDLSDLPEQGSVMEAVWELDQSAEMGTIRSFLARFGYLGEDVLKPIAALSGGEKTKLCLARLLYHPANLIIMDEPTNHLDMQAREALEEALREYDGSLLIVSHDRFFLDRVINKLIHINNGRATVFPGKYAEFRERVSASVSFDEQKKNDAKQKSTQSYQEFKEESRRRSRLKKELQSTRSKIADKERELAALESSIRHEIPSHDWERLQQAADEKNSLEQEILTLYMKVDKLEATNDD